MAGLRGNTRVVHHDPRIRRNAANLSSVAEFTAAGGAITLNDDGQFELVIATDEPIIQAGGLALVLAAASGLTKSGGELAVLLDPTEPGLQLTSGLKVMLASTPGLELSSGLKAKVQGVLSIDASGIKLSIGNGLTNNAGSLVIVPGDINHDALLNYVANEHINHSGVSINSGTGLTGGGSIAASRTLALDVNSLTAEGTPDGAADYFVMYDASAGAHRKVLGDNLPGNVDLVNLEKHGVLAPHIGLLVRTDATNDATQVNIEADKLVVTNSSDEQVLLSSVSLTADITTSGANGLDTGTEATDTWYHLWVIYNGTTAAALLSTSDTSPTLPSGWTHKGYVGAVRNNASSDFLEFVQNGPHVGTDLGQSLEDGTATTPTALDLSSHVPPTARKAVVFISLVENSGSAGQRFAFIFPVDNTGSASGPGTLGKVQFGQTLDAGARFDLTLVSVIYEPSTLYYAVTSGGRLDMFLTQYEY